MNWLKKFFSFRNPAIFLIGVYLLDLLGFVNANTLDFIFALLIGFVVAILENIATEIKANRTMNLILYNTIINKGLVNNEDVFLTQNDLLGDTPSVDVDKLIKIFRKNRIYLHEYIDDDEINKNINEIKTENLSIFGSFANLVDRYKESNISKIKINRDKKEGKD